MQNYIEIVYRSQQQQTTSSSGWLILRQIGNWPPLSSRRSRLLLRVHRKEEVCRMEINLQLHGTLNFDDPNGIQWSLVWQVPHKFTASSIDSHSSRADCAKYWTSPEQSIYANHFNIAVGWTKIICRPARYFIVVVNCCDHALKKSCLMFTISLSSPVHRQIETVDHRETGNNNKCTI